jgi:hypothetical protein
MISEWATCLRYEIMGDLTDLPETRRAVNDALGGWDALDAWPG